MDDACTPHSRPTAPTSAPGECGCTASSSGAAAKVTKNLTRDWGLPTPGCSARWTRYFTEVYPRQHAEWRAQGRVVVHCCASSGLGNYLRSLPSALVYSMITEQALTLACDDPEHFVMEKNGVPPSQLPGHLARFFRGPHFDWSFTYTLPRGVPSIDLGATQMNPGRWAWNASRGSRVTTTMATHARRVLMFSKSMPYFGRYFGRQPSGKEDILDKYLNLDGCLLRYLLAPRQVLQVPRYPLMPLITS